jgi:hypothetical protein
MNAIAWVEHDVGEDEDASVHAQVDGHAHDQKRNV